MHVTGGLHVLQNVILKLRNRLQGVRHVLVLLDVPDNFRCLGPLRKIDEVGLLDDRRDTIFDERQIGQVNTYIDALVSVRAADDSFLFVPKKGMQGGLALCSASLYSIKFFVLPMSLRITSNVLCVFWLTCAHVRERRWMGAVSRAQTIDVSVEKLFSCRHFCTAH